jgi:molybdopterin-guanine dinucleotide biosynthesis protein A
MQDLSAFVLAGGRSSRLGRDKALLPLGDRNFLQIALDNAKGVCPTPLIVGSRSLYAAYGEVIEDRIPGCGPLGGIHAALSATTSDLNLALSVDMPLMVSSFLKWLAKQAKETAASVTVPRSGSRLQPLCAVYHRAILPQIEAALSAGRYRVDAVFAHVITRIIDEHEMTSAGFTTDIFRNVNTPQEYESLTRLSLQEAAAARAPQP